MAGSTAFDKKPQSIFLSSFRFFQKLNAMGLPISMNNGAFVLDFVERGSVFWELM